MNVGQQSIPSRKHGKVLLVLIKDLLHRIAQESFCELRFGHLACKDQGHLDEAETLLQRSHRDSGKQLGEQHPVTLSLGIGAPCDTAR